MTTNDDDFARKITPYLDDAAAQLKAGTAYRLQLARAEALARLAEPERATATSLTPALAGAGARCMADARSGSASRASASARASCSRYAVPALICAAASSR